MRYPFVTVGHYVITALVPEDRFSPVKLAMVSLAGLGIAVTTMAFSTSPLLTYNAAIVTILLPLPALWLAWALHSFVVKALGYERRGTELRVLSNKLRCLMRLCFIFLTIGVLWLVIGPTGFSLVLSWYLTATAAAAWILCFVMRDETNEVLRIVRSAER